MSKHNGDEYQPKDALDMMVENINLGNEVEDLKKRLNKLQHDYLVKCEEVDHWKQFYVGLARTVYSAPVVDTVQKPLPLEWGGEKDGDGFYYDPESDYTER